MAIGAVAAVAIVYALSADAAPGDDDATFVPIPNCRLFDFRPGDDNVGPKNTPLGPGDANAYTQQVTGTNGNCNIPDDAIGVSLNTTIVGPTAQSNLRIFPADEATPLASSLNWLAGQSPTPNAVVVKLSPDGKITLFNQFGTVFVLADANGYYTSASLKELASQGGQVGPQGPAGPQGEPGEGVATVWAKVDGDANEPTTILAGKGAIGAERVSTGAYVVQFDRSIVGCGYIATLTDNDAGSANNGEISVERANSQVNDKVWVQTRNSEGFPEDQPASDGFTVLALCP
ncbi:MAG: hypothetical protein AAFY28_10615 [Actinomycetota bacterium]